MIVDRWGESFETDEEISGFDAVDSLANYVEVAQVALSTEPEKPTYQDLVAALGMAVAEWSYLFPEKFDDTQHEEQSRKNLRKAAQIHKRALRVLGKEMI